MSGSEKPVDGCCGAKIRKSNPPRYCQRKPLRGRTRCRLHGGLSRRGVNAARYKTGAHSKFAWLSPKLAGKVADLEADKELTNLRPDLALLEALKREAAAGLEIGASVESWRTARTIFEAMRKARTSGDVDEQLAQEEKLRALLFGGGHTMAREEVTKLLERKARMVAVYHDMQTKSQNLIPVAQVQMLLAGVELLVKEIMTDVHQQAQFGHKLLAYLSDKFKAAPVTIDVTPEKRPELPGD